MSKTNINELIPLCNCINGEYIAKEGKDYIDALSHIYNLENKNDHPFTIEDIKNQPTMDEFTFSGVNEFKKTCNLVASPLKIINTKKQNEKIIPCNFVDEDVKNIFFNANGIVYIFTCEIDGKEHIIKIGQSRKTFADRLQSYNCGTVSNWRTASTTNIKILQSMVTTRLIFNLYLYDCSDNMYQLNWHGVESEKFSSPKSLAVENIMVNQFIDIFGCKPLANIQTDINDKKKKKS